ncbi:hypothetical protein P171DRAFT_444781 [Karstenula rhodostoma CBS 690.94]|uniref:Uncharacterized protein n=1 Tax=Karstenula rhodostoma CBS 690.94 TaxID=1392251 RepID=A0A9P4PHN1_9PLEO|nr:hypothetical protein P171DRAFT_444781 [Karstenula rhodostoma CBS 690.94]
MAAHVQNSRWRFAGFDRDSCPHQERQSDDEAEHHQQQHGRRDLAGATRGRRSQRSAGGPASPERSISMLAPSKLGRDAAWPLEAWTTLGNIAVNSAMGGSRVGRCGHVSVYRSNCAELVVLGLRRRGKRRLRSRSSTQAKLITAPGYGE